MGGARGDTPVVTISPILTPSHSNPSTPLTNSPLLKGGGLTTPPASQASPITTVLVTPSAIQGKTGQTTPTTSQRLGLATPPSTITQASASLSASSSLDFNDLKTKLKSVSSPILATSEKGKFNFSSSAPNVGVPVATPPKISSSVKQAVPPLVSRTTPPPIDPRGASKGFKVVKKTSTGSTLPIQLPKHTINALLSALKNPSTHLSAASNLYTTSDVAHLVAVTTPSTVARQQATPPQRLMVVSAPSGGRSQASPIRVVQSPSPMGVALSHPLGDHLYVSTPSPSSSLSSPSPFVASQPHPQAPPTPQTTSGLSLLTSNFITKTTTNNY